VTTISGKMPAYMRRFALNTAQKRMVTGLCQDPLGSLQHSPDSLAGLRGKERDAKGGRRKEGQRKARGGGREGNEDAVPLLSDFLATPRNPHLSHYPSLFHCWPKTRMFYKSAQHRPEVSLKTAFMASFANCFFVFFFVNTVYRFKIGIVLAFTVFQVS